MQLKNIQQISGQIKLLTGLHIGAGNEEVHIGGIDNAVIKHPHTGQPYIPGSSLKGKMRSLLEWRAGIVSKVVVQNKKYTDVINGKPISLDMLEHLSNEPNKLNQAKNIIKLFGMAGDTKNTDKAAEIGATRLSFWDCFLNQKEWEKVAPENSLYTEAKSENTINRITGTADHPRQIERVPAGVFFDFKLNIKVLTNKNDQEEDFLNTVLQGLKLLEFDSIGGSGSRGYGKIKFINLKLNDDDLQSRFDAVKPFTEV
jgi:CRISPR-associated protein Csm3